MAHHQVIVVGGGTAGLAVAALLRNQENPPEVAIVEPSDKHYYQPIWTLVGGGVFDRSISEKDEADFIPEGATWIKDFVDSFDPDNNTLTTRDGTTYSYDYLVVTAGIQINWDAIPGLKDSVMKPGTGVCSNYSYDTVMYTWENLKNLKSGRAIFTQPNTPIKCGGAPQKIMHLSCHYLQKNGRNNNVEVVFASAGGGMFAVPKYKKELDKIIARNKVNTKFGHNLVSIDAENKKATFEILATGENVVMDYDMLHVTPPMGPPDFIKNSPLAAETGWVSVDKFTTQHTKYANVFSIGDCSNLPTSKTGAAIRKQAPTLVENLNAAMNGKPLSAAYDGYTSCPLVTGYGRLILAEFDYNKEPMESFPFDQSKERYSMYALKAYALPNLYWHGMLKGRKF